VFSCFLSVFSGVCVGIGLRSAPGRGRGRADDEKVSLVAQRRAFVNRRISVENSRACLEAGGRRVFRHFCIPRNKPSSILARPLRLFLLLCFVLCFLLGILFRNRALRPSPRRCRASPHLAGQELGSWSARPLRNPSSWCAAEVGGAGHVVRRRLAAPRGTGRSAPTLARRMRCARGRRRWAGGAPWWTTQTGAWPCRPNRRTRGAPAGRR
jgi:hypothetical protein